MRKLELLAPAKNLAVGKAAIDCGADAVYIGGPRFGARAAAGNSVEDIHELCLYAHKFGAKVYLTLNTLLYDNEKEEAKALLHQAAEIGVDAVLIQDLSLLAPNHIPSPMMGKGANMILHASTQTDNRNAKRVKYLRSLGFKRVVLARELSLEEIRKIHEEVPDVELEAFVHGALCVSYSGACYASEYCFGRSANRGECAQFCRMKFDLLDADGKEIEHQRHLLSLKDMCQIDHLEEMADAGVVSFKIEGRLKDENYVKNVVAAYSQRLNRLCEKRPEDYCRSSLGNVKYAFTPNLKKTFNRGYTNYFLNGREPDIFSPDTPKAIGEYVGKVKEIRGNSFNVAGTAAFANGDGLCFINKERELQGFRVNRAEGNRLFPLQMPKELRAGMALYRNCDMAFEKELARPGTERKIPLMLTFGKTEGGFYLSARAQGYAEGRAEVMIEHQKAQKPQRDNIIRQLSKWGGTIYEVEDIKLKDGVEDCFIPSSVLSELRRSLTPLTPSPKEGWGVNTPAGNILEGLEDAEIGSSRYDGKKPLMQCRHCLRYALGHCVKNGGTKANWKEPLRLRLGDGREFPIEFDCKNCQMNVLKG